MTAYPQHLQWLPAINSNARFVAPRLVVCSDGCDTHRDLGDELRYVLDLRDPTDTDDRATQRWRHPEHHTAACIAHLRLLPVTDGATVPAEAVAEAVAWYRDVRAMAPDALVVVQCYAGVSRSATMAYAILRACYGLGHVAARHRVRTMYEGEFVGPVWNRLREAARWCDGQLMGVR